VDLPEVITRSGSLDAIDGLPEIRVSCQPALNFAPCPLFAIGEHDTPPRCLAAR
jgi:hypothetical protein